MTLLEAAKAVIDAYKETVRAEMECTAPIIDLGLNQRKDRRSE